MDTVSTAQRARMAPAMPRPSTSRTSARPVHGIHINTFILQRAGPCSTALPPSRARLQPVRVVLSDVQEIAQIAAEDMPIASIIGYAAGAVFAGLWFMEKQKVSGAEAELALAKGKLAEQQAELDKQKAAAIDTASKLQAELDKERSDAKDSKRRLEEYSKDTMKLEKALEQKDAQIEAFMVVSQRQIKYLEDKVKEMQKIPAI